MAGLRLSSMGELDVGTRHAFLRVWTDFVLRMAPAAVDSLCGEMRTLEIMSTGEYRNVVNHDGGDREKAKALMKVIESKNDELKQTISRLLCKADGVGDLGRRLCELQGLQPQRAETVRQDIQTIIVPHEDAYRDLTDVIETLTIEKNLQAEEIRALKETNQRISRTLVLRSAPVAVQAKATCPLQWKEESSLQRGVTVNCLASTRDNIVACSWAGSRLYKYPLTLSDELPTWSTIGVPDSPIWNVFTRKDEVCIRAGDNKIYYMSDTWKHLADMPNTLTMKQGSASLLADDNHIYRLGGYNGDTLDIAAVYDLGSRLWSCLPKMPFTSRWCSSVLLDNSLYVAGGCTRRANGRLYQIADMAALDLREKQWRRLTPLEHYNATIAAMDGLLFASGGTMDQSVNDTAHDSNRRAVSFLDFKNGAWLPHIAMENPRSFHGMCSTEDIRLVVAGGKNTDSVEILSFN